MRIVLPLALLLMVPAAAFAGAGAQATATVYVYAPPQMMVQISENSSGLTCGWTITDPDVGDTFSSTAEWSVDGKQMPELSSEVNDCVAGKACHSPLLSPAKEDEEWTCKVKVTDSYGAVGNGETSYTIVPLGFFGGLFKEIACNWFKWC